MNPRGRDDDRRGRRGRRGGGQGGGYGGRGGGGQGGGYGGGRGGGRGGRYDRDGGGGGAGGRGDVEQHGRDGSFRSSVRIIGLEQLQDAIKNQEQAQPAEPEDTPSEGKGSTGGGPENLARSSS